MPLNLEAVTTTADTLLLWYHDQAGREISVPKVNACQQLLKHVLWDTAESYNKE